jgi:L-iditol 2-dehydrogenase
VPAAFLTARRHIEVDDVPVPVPGPGEALIELTAVGICGSDLHYFRHGRIGPRPLTLPQVLGHEPAGTIAGLGRGVARLKEGERVAIEPGISCGRCRPCRQGRPNLCARVRFLGSPGVAGAFQRYLTMPVICLRRVPPGVDAALASAAEPLGVALHALRLVGLRRGEAVGVIGCGPIGLSVLALCRATGAKVVAMSDPRAVRRSVAERLGARGVVEPEAFDETAREATGGWGVSVLFECSGAAEMADTAIAATEPGGRIALVGIPEADALTVDPHAWRTRELTIVQVRRSRDTLSRVLGHLSRGGLGLARAGFFSETVGLGGLQAAFEQLDDNASPAVKVIVDPRI